MTVRLVEVNTLINYFSCIRRETATFWDLGLFRLSRQRLKIINIHFFSSSFYSLKMRR